MNDNKNIDKFNKLLAILMILFSIIILLLIPALAKQFRKTFDVNEQSTTITKPIKSLQIDKEHDKPGIFTLGIDQNYTTYYVNIKGEKGYILTPLDSESVELVETDEKDPCIEITTNVLMSNTYTIYVPVGTINQTYNATIQNN